MRLEYLEDSDGFRTGFGSKLGVFGATATAQYKIWKGLVGRVEYRHDGADERVFQGGTRKSQDTLGVSLFYSFF